MFHESMTAIVKSFKSQSHTLNFETLNPKPLNPKMKASATIPALPASLAAHLQAPAVRGSRPLLETGHEDTLGILIGIMEKKIQTTKITTVH